MKFLLLATLFSFSAFSHVTEITGSFDVQEPKVENMKLADLDQDYLNGVSDFSESFSRLPASIREEQNELHVNVITGTFQ